MSDCALVRYKFFTDGCCLGNGKQANAPMGAGVVGICNGQTREWCAQLGPGTNNQAELLAVKLALEVLQERPFSYVEVFTDSRYVIGVLQENMRAQANVELVEACKRLMAECGFVQLCHVPGHAGVGLNELAHKIAARAARGVVTVDRVVEVTSVVPRSEPDATSLEQHCQYLQAEVDHLLKVVRYYADPLAYFPPVGEDAGRPSIALDRGEAARKALLALGYEIVAPTGPFTDEHLATAKP